MKRINLALALYMLALSCEAVSTPSERLVQCVGSTSSNAAGRVSVDPETFSAVFRWAGSRVDVVGFQQPGFSKSYAASPAISLDGRPGFASDAGNLFFFTDSGRFEIVRNAVLPTGLETKTTSGTCEPFTPSPAFN